MKHSTRLYAIAIIMAIMQFYDTQSLVFGFWALLCLMFARICEGAEYWQDQQKQNKD